jgi:glyoxylase-like metal-dependent hydrolase (beta-lactamase superfamily II)
VDHIVGNNAIVEHFDINGAAHKDVLAFFEQAPTYAQSLGFSVRNLILPTEILADGDVIKFGESALSVLHTPGHADGSVCFYSEADQFVIVGDVLFKGSIGRTDLPSGNFNVLTQSILDKLYTLPSGVKVYSGHGPSTSIGFEKINNPFVNLL